MDLRQFLEGLPKGGITMFAGKLRISTVYLSQISARQDGRAASPALCVRIEQESGWAVRRWDLRPDDWHLIWPELISADGAPALPAAEKAGA